MDDDITSHNNICEKIKALKHDISLVNELTGLSESKLNNLN